jgi:hypothetical protein
VGSRLTQLGRRLLSRPGHALHCMPRAQLRAVRGQRPGQQDALVRQRQRFFCCDCFAAGAGGVTSGACWLAGGTRRYRMRRRSLRFAHSVAPVSSRANWLTKCWPIIGWRGQVARSAGCCGRPSLQLVPEGNCGAVLLACFHKVKLSPPGHHSICSLCVRVVVPESPSEAIVAPVLGGARTTVCDPKLYVRLWFRLGAVVACACCKATHLADERCARY